MYSNSLGYLNEIRRERVFTRLDLSSGKILNETAWGKIEPVWIAPLLEAKKAYFDTFGDENISIYVRGSVPQGRALKGFSDVDTFAITIGSVDSIKLKSQSESLSKKFPWATRIELQSHDWKTVCQNERKSLIPFQIKTQSLLLHGIDLADELDDFFPNSDLVNLIRSTTMARLEENLNKLQARLDYPEWRAWLIRVLIRLSFSMLVEDKHQYTRDLYTIVTSIGDEFPNLDSLMLTALNMALFPNRESESVQNIASQLVSGFAEAELINSYKSCRFTHDIRMAEFVPIINSIVLGS